MKEYILRTPLLRSDIKSKTNIYLKAENLQFLGSYKIRGIAEALKLATPEKIQQGLIAASAGNMAQAVAFAAGLLNVSCRIFVPSSAPEVKKSAIRQLKAKLVELPFDEIWEMVKTPPVTDGIFFHPVLTSGLQEGYGTIGKEILEDLPSVDAVVIPFGVGGLSLGLSKYLKKHKPDIKIFTCEPETAAPFSVSLKNGFASKVQRKPSLVDAIGTPEVLEFVYNEVSELIEDSLVVSIEETKVALQDLANRNKIVCEGAAGVAYAAAKQLQAEDRFENIVAVLSGGNVPEVHFFK